MANKKFWPGILIMALVFGTAIIGCDNAANDGSAGGSAGGSSDDITYTVEANGILDTETSSQLTFTFSDNVSGLRVEDIDIIDSNTTGKAEKDGRALNGTLTGSDKSWTLSITKVTAGKIRIQIDKPGVERGRKTVLVHRNSASGGGFNEAITLTNALWEDGYLAELNTELWYKFEAESGASYKVQWDKGYILVTAYQSDHTTEIFRTYYMEGAVSGVTGTVYLKLELTNMIGAGKFTIRFFDPESMGEGPKDKIIIYSPLRESIVPSVVFMFSASPLDSLESTGFRVYRSETEDGTYTQIGDIDITDIGASSYYIYNDTTVQAGKPYWYKIAGFNSKGEGEKSDPMGSEVIPQAEAEELSLGTTKNAEITELTQVDWYKFTAENGKAYKLQWESIADNNVGGWTQPYFAQIVVSVFSAQSPLNNEFFREMGWGWSDPRTISGWSGPVYIKVKNQGEVGLPYTITVSEE